MNLIIEAIGWIGAVLIVTAYCLNIFGRWSSSSKLYIAFNIIGGVFFIINTFVHKAYPSMIVNVIWVIIALSALFKKDKK